MTQSTYQYDLIRRIEELERAVKRVAGNSEVGIPGVQILPDGTVFMPGGIATGSPSTVVYEPYILPTVTGVSASWGANFETIFIDVSWLAPTGYGADQIASYVVQATKAGEVPIESTVSSGELQTRLQPVEPNTAYTITVWAQSRNGRNSIAQTTTITTGGDTTAPAAPTFPASAVLPGIEALAIKWNANTERDVANGAGQYRVRVSTASNLASPILDVKVNGTYYWAPSLVAGTPYYVGVNAVDSSGNQSPVAQPPGGPWTPSAVVTTDVAFLDGGGNVLLNSGFEDFFSPPDSSAAVKPGSWVVAGNGATIQKTTSDPAHGAFGSGTLKITGTGDAYVYQDRTLNKGTYTFSTWAKSTSLSGTGAGACLNFEALSGTVGNIVLVKGTAWNGNRATAGKGTYDWTRIACRFDVTSASANVRLYLQRGGGGSLTGTTWFDEAQLEAGTTLTAYAPRPDEINGDSITSVAITNDAVTAPKLAANSVVAGKVAANTIGANEIIAASITGAKIAADTITSGNIAANAITTSELAANSVTATAINAGAVTTAKLAADSVDATKLTALSIAVGKFIQSSSYVAGTTGWRIDGAGNAEFNNATVRGSTFVGGTIQIADRIFASPADPTVHLAANVEIGSGFSGTLYSGDINWGGFQMANNAGVLSTLVRGQLGAANREVGFFDTTTGSKVFAILGGSYDKVFYGSKGRLLVDKRNQGAGVGGAGIVVENWGTPATGYTNTEAAITLHTPDYGNATTLKHWGPFGSALEVRDGNDNNFAPVKASAFQVISASDTKTDIQDMPVVAKSKVKDLKPKKFRRERSECSVCVGTGKVVNGSEDLPVGNNCPICKGKPGSPNIPEPAPTFGLMAEDVAALIPDAVVFEGTKAAAIDYSALVAVLIAKVQELESDIATLKKAK